MGDLLSAVKKQIYTVIADTGTNIVLRRFTAVAAPAAHRLFLSCLRLKHCDVLAVVAGSRKLRRGFR
jgi:hypothetical protein